MSTVPTTTHPAPTPSGGYSFDLPDGRIVLSPAPMEQFDGYVGIVVGDPDDQNLRADVTLAEGDTVWRCWYPDHVDEEIPVDREIDIARVCLRAAQLTLELNGASTSGGAA